MKTVLVIDDSKIILRAVKNTLKEKYTVIALTEGKAALEYLEKNTCDLIMLDYEMPVMNGLEVFRELRGREETKNIPIIFLTGNREADTVSQVLALKPEGYIVKPAAPDELLKRVEDILG